MGQKSHPIGLRLLKTNRHFQSAWYTRLEYGSYFTRQLQAHTYLEKLFGQIGAPTGGLSMVSVTKKTRLLFSYFDRLESRQDKTPLLGPILPPQTRPFPARVWEAFERKKERFFPLFLLRNQAYFHPATLGSRFVRAEREMMSDSFLARLASRDEGTFLRLFLFSALFERGVVSSAREVGGSMTQASQIERLRWFHEFLSSRLAPIVATGEKRSTEESLRYLSRLFESFAGSPVWVDSWRAKWESQAPAFLAMEIAFLLEKRVSFRRIKSFLIRTLEENKNGRWNRVQGIRVSCAGRVGGGSGKKAQRAKTESFQWGETSLHVFSEKVDFSQKVAVTVFGLVGVKVWICYR